MNRKAQISMGGILIAAIAIIVGLVLLQQVATNTEQVTRDATGVVEVLNTTIAGTAGTTYELTGQELVTVLGVANESGGESVAATNYTIAECVRDSDGLKGICYYALEGDWDAKGINVSYTSFPAGYADDAGSRAIAAIIVLLASIAIAIAVLPDVRELFK